MGSEYYTEADLQRLIREELKNRPAPRDSGWTKVFIVFVLALLSLMVADYFHLISPALIDKVIGPPPAATFSTPQGGGARQAPQSMPAVQENGAQAPPGDNLEPFYNKTPAPVFAGEIVTAEPTPTSSSFYTPAEQTAFALSDAETATAVSVTATAFIVEIPTAPPEFEEYVREECKDKEKVAQSGLLQMMCGGGDE